MKIFLNRSICMRFIKVKLPVYYENVIDSVLAKYPNASKISRDFYCDLLFIIAQGYDVMWKYIVSVEDIFNEVFAAYVAGKISNMRKYEAELFLIRLDLIDFADSYFGRLLKEDPVLKLEEKFEFMVIVFDEMVSKAPREELNNMAKLNNYSELSDNKSDNLDGGDVRSAENKAIYSMSANFFKGFSFLMSNFFTDNNKEVSSGGVSYGFSRTTSFINDSYKEILSNKVVISSLVDKLWDAKYLEIFNIAKNIEFMFDFSKKGKLVNVDKVSSNITVGRLKKYADINRATKLDLSMDDVIDRKIMDKSLKVINYKDRVDQKQLLYALLDCSGSTRDFYHRISINRIAFIKAIAIALGKKAIADKSKFYFRWFNGNVFDVYKLQSRSQWGNFLKHILNRSAIGGTNIDLALHVASGDIFNEIDGMDKCDIIVITDGTTDVCSIDELIELKKKGAKFHFVCLEDIVKSSSVSNMEKIAETFQVVDLDKVDDLSVYKPTFRKVI